MNKDYVALNLQLLESSNPVQAKKYKMFLENCNQLYYKKANWFFSLYENLLKDLGRDFSYTVDCYNQMISEMLLERIGFLSTGRYSNTSFSDVSQRLYKNPEAFEHHMHGLALAQFVWWDQYQRFDFFAQNISQYINKTHCYLEVGAGHGLFIAEAISQFKKETIFDLVDISPTSLEMSQKVLSGYPVNYFLQDIFDYYPEKKYDFITIGEVLEHLEDPKRIMLRLKELLKDNGIIYLTTPANAPMIDHIYLFNNDEEIRDLVRDSGFEIENELTAFAENMDEKKAIKNKVPLMYAAFIKK
jgi:SAM-dependent methyltransferase